MEEKKNRQKFEHNPPRPNDSLAMYIAVVILEVPLNLNCMVF